MDAARKRIEGMLEANPDKVPSSMEQIMGEWELVLYVAVKGIKLGSTFHTYSHPLLDIFPSPRAVRQ